MRQSILGRALTWLATEYRARQAIRHLAMLDNHLLRDIGLERGQICDAVRGRILQRSAPDTGHRGRRARFFAYPGPQREVSR